jgi:uncharacterized protein YbcI
MPEQQVQLQGVQLLSKLSGAMVTMFRDFLGKGPERCKTYWVGSDMLVVLLGGGYSTAEQTLFEAGRGNAVQQSRRALQQTLAERMKDTVEQLTGRKVVAFLSASHQEPDLSAEIFVLEPLEADSPADSPHAPG